MKSDKDSVSVNGEKSAVTLLIDDPSRYPYLEGLLAEKYELQIDTGSGATSTPGVISHDAPKLATGLDEIFEKYIG